MISFSQDIVHALEKALPGQVRTDQVTRYLFSTDASLYQVEPLGVVFPRTTDDLAASVEIAAKYGVPVLPRGSGSSLAGQAIGQALILDCSRFLNRIIEINPEEETATVEPGVILNALNRSTLQHGLQFGPDPASAERATLGGSIANNATGAHSLIYGMTADHLLEAEVVLANGSIASLGETSLEEAERIAQKGESILPNLYATALSIREHCAESIQNHWPRTWRCASGYTINYLLPWTATKPPLWERIGCKDKLTYPPIRQGTINLAPLLAGSEGTLAVIRKAKLRLVRAPKHTILGVLAYPGLTEACDAVSSLLEMEPSAIELIPKELISLARSVPAYCRMLSFVDQLSSGKEEPPALLVVEFAGSNLSLLKAQVSRLGNKVYIAESAEAQKQVWAVRKVGMGLFMSRPGDKKPVAFIEDLSVPVNRLGHFVREMQRILSDHGTVGDFYAHASAGCLHIRPVLNLKSPQGRAALRSIASQAVQLTLGLGGAISGEHGDGIARSEWLEQEFGKEILAAFHRLKNSADPAGLLNPGKIIQPGPMDSSLRYGHEYLGKAWQPALDFSLRVNGEDVKLTGESGFVAAVEHCNGAGVCRKSEGVMCPSFQATHEEMHSTRGRANLLRAMISGAFPAHSLAEKTVKEALDLCLACKGCKAECPSGVDMAKIKYEFFNHYYDTRRRRLRDYLFGYIGVVARMGHPFAPLVNQLLSSELICQLGERFFGLASRRPFPHIAVQPLQKLIRHSPASPLHTPDIAGREDVIFLSDAFTEYFQPQVGLAAVQSLQACGCRVHLLPVLGAGRTLISKGFLGAARRQAIQVLESIQRLDPLGRIPVTGVEPSEIFTLRDEYLDMFPGDSSRQQQARDLAGRAWMIDEFLIRPGGAEEPRLSHLVATKKGLHNQKDSRRVLLHGHCYQKAQLPAPDGYPTGIAATIAMLKMVGYEVHLIDSSCCGMAGAFGYESEHYDLSMQVGELGLFPAVRKASPEVIIAASGVSCQAQIADGAQREAVHPVTLLL